MADPQIVKMLKAVSDANRLSILELIGDEELCSCKLLENLDISQPTLSHHLRILAESGLIIGRKEAQWIHYRIDMEKLGQLRQYLSTAFTRKNVITDIE